MPLQKLTDKAPDWVNQTIHDRFQSAINFLRANDIITSATAVKAWGSVYAMNMLADNKNLRMYGGKNAKQQQDVPSIKTDI